jgi:hypothetical protein
VQTRLMGLLRNVAGMCMGVGGGGSGWVGTCGGAWVWMGRSRWVGGIWLGSETCEMVRHGHAWTCRDEDQRTATAPGHQPTCNAFIAASKRKVTR